VHGRLERLKLKNKSIEEYTAEFYRVAILVILVKENEKSC